MFINGKRLVKTITSFHLHQKFLIEHLDESLLFFSEFPLHEAHVRFGLFSLFDNFFLLLNLFLLFLRLLQVELLNSLQNESSEGLTHEQDKLIILEMLG